MDSDVQTRATIEEHWRASESGDTETEHAMYAADAILDYPQSGERFRSRATISAQRGGHPATRHFVEGFSFAMWAFGYEPALWSVVFPLGMYSVATLTFGKVAHLAFMEPVSRFMLWVAVAAWLAVAAAFAARIRGASGFSSEAADL